jgi:hypothetical protein
MNKGEQYPHVWITGTDPERHARYRIWAQQRNQALWRGEGWELTFDTWLAIWESLWPRRGRCRGHMCMSRSDWDLPWSPDNVSIITREEHARLQSRAKSLGRISRARSREKEHKCK